MNLTNFLLRLKSYIFHKSFFLGLLIAIGSFSPYIFGPDNLAEELAELFIYEETGIDIDFTPKTKEHILKNVQEITDITNNYRFL
jgi:hypothetical protein